MAATTQISSLIVDAIVTKLTTDLITNNTEPTEDVSVVRGGRLQDNPFKGTNGIFVLVHMGDPDDDNWKDVSAAFREEELRRDAYRIPPFEVGGGSMWFRRGTVEWGVFATRTKEDRDDARAKAMAIQGKIERAIAQTTVGNLQDDFGESAVQIFPVWANNHEGGGPPRSYIWRGKIGYQVLSGRSY